VGKTVLVSIADAHLAMNRIKNIIKAVLGSVLGPKKILWRHAPDNMQAIALTFDDGPHPVYTPQVLDQLQAVGGKATFFLLGKHVEQYPEIVERILAEGHEVGCHTYSHLRFSEHSQKEVLNDLKLSDDALGRLGASSRLFRPPYGNLPLRHIPMLCKLNKQIIFWSIDSRDFELESGDQVISRVDFSRVKSGEVLLFHDCHQSTIEALPEVGRLAGELGLSLVTVSELIEN